MPLASSKIATVSSLADWNNGGLRSPLALNGQKGAVVVQTVESNGRLNVVLITYPKP